jgi:hypothetical protein
MLTTLRACGGVRGCGGQGGSVRSELGTLHEHSVDDGSGSFVGGSPMGGAAAGSPSRMPRKRIGGKIKLSYTPALATPVARPFTEEDEG